MCDLGAGALARAGSVGVNRSRYFALFLVSGFVKGIGSAGSVNINLVGDGEWGVGGGGLSSIAYVVRMFVLSGPFPRPSYPAPRPQSPTPGPHKILTSLN